MKVYTHIHINSVQGSKEEEENKEKKRNGKERKGKRRKGKEKGHNILQGKTQKRKKCRKVQISLREA